MGIGTQLKYLALNVLVLAELAGIVAYVNHLVRFKSGIDSNDTLRRVWSKPEVVAFQPIFSPLLLSVLFAVGMNSLARSVMIGLLEVLDTLHASNDMKMNTASEFAATFAGTVCGSLAGTLVYKLDSGGLVWTQIGITLVLAVAGTVTRTFNQLSASLVVVWSLLVALAHVLVGFYVNRLVPLRQPAAEVPSAPIGYVTQNKRKVWVILFACFLLYIQRILDFIGKVSIFQSSEKTIYLAQVLQNFSSVLVLTICVFLSILITNFNINRNCYSWQWLALLTPTLVILPLEIPLCFHYPADYYKSTTDFVFQIIKQIFMYAACGYLGSAVYLTVLARAALIALDPGFEGQSELILDEDDSEYEV